jgi:hypothetical protein
MLASSYSEAVRLGVSLTIEEYLSLYHDDPRFDEWRPADLLDYDATLRLYADAFGEQNVLILPFELPRDDPQVFIARLEDRLGLERRREQLFRLNRSLSQGELY